MKKEDSLEINQPVPDFLLTGINVENRLFSSLAGNIVVLNVWATWCAPCRRELPSLQRLSEMPGLKGIKVIGLSVDEDKHIAREYLIDKKINFPNYIDERSMISNQVLKVTAYPDTLIIDKEGNLMHRVVGGRDWSNSKTVDAIRQLLLGNAVEVQTL